MTTKKKVLIIILILMSIPILANFGNNFRKSIIARGEIAAARQDAEKSADEKAGGAANALKESGTVTGSLGSSKVDVCYVTHNDQGWTAVSWYQDCYIRYVDGFATELAKDEVKKRLLSSPMAATYFGQEDTTSVGSTALYCGLYENNYETTLLYRFAHVNSDEYSCKVPNPLQGIGSVKGPIIQDDELSVKTYKTLDAHTMSNSQNQVWVMFDEHYYHEELGCGIGIFCENPRNKPVHPSI